MLSAAPVFGVYRTLSVYLKKVGFSARVIKQLFALLLITAMVMSPLLFFRDQRVIAAERHVPAAVPPPVSAPPEPFVLPSHGITEKLLPAVSELFASLAGYFSRTPPSEADVIATDRDQLPPAFRSALAGHPANVAAETALDPPPPPQAGATTFDFDGDGKADISRWHSPNTEFKIRNSGSSTYSTYTIGSTTAREAPADYDGDGRTDPAFFDSGTWTIRQSSTGATATVTGFGLSGDIPLPGNYVGGSEIDEAVFRPSNSTWYFRDGGGTHAVTSVAFGTTGDIPVPGDYDGDGKTDHAVFRPSNGTWYIQPSGGGSFYGVSWGLSSDVPVPGDYDGDGKTDASVFRPGTGVWYVKLSTTGGATYTSFTWGNYADQPAPADYDGDGKTDYAVWRPATGAWWIYLSASSTYFAYTLGVSGDFAVESAFVKQVNGNVETDDLAVARLSPKNATGDTDLYSQNFSWGTGLVSLPGRAGLDLSLGISYNSLVWTKVGSTVVFDPDYSSVTPGFSFGFPTIEPNYYDGAKSTYSYLMVTPSGRRIEFRQSAVSGTYETADSTYAQLVASSTDPNADATSLTIKVTTTDGTQMSYAWNNGAFRCTEIRDRNGNRITITNNSHGQIDYITDTLGRVVTVNYNSDGLPTSITQTWKDTNGSGSNTTHTWASFAYTTTDGATGHAPSLSTNFGSLTVAGPPNGTSIKVLQQITYADSSYTKFTYNNYAQVVKVQNYAPNNDELNHVLLNDISSVTGTQSDCPRFSVVKNFAENFNGGAETTVTNTYNTVSNYSIYSGQSISGTRIDTVLTSDPDSHYSRSFYGSSGWQEGLPLATEDCIGVTTDNCSTRKRWTWESWTQDNTSLSYNLNPRVTETRVGDGTNTKRTTIDYRYDSGTGSYLYGLPETVKVYDADLSTVLKTQKTTYNLDSNYTSRRIIGLPAESDLWQGVDGSGTLMSKVTYAFDESGYTATPQSVSPTQHDDTNYGTAFNYRGNSTSTTRWDATDPTNTSKKITSSVVYNTAGLPISQTDPRGRVVQIGYTDSWNDTDTHAQTYAYPTVLTDPNGTSLGDTAHSSFIKYRYDIGANVQADSPAPAGNTYGKETRRVFDDVGRLQRNSIYTNPSGTWQEYSYVRYAYPTNGIQSQTYSTITDTNSNGVGDSADEILTESWTDGAGNVRQSRVPHTFNTDGTTATWAATFFEYDILGRATRQSVPTEVDSSWNAAGDDYTRGFLWNYQYYDWKGRTTRTVPSDSNGSDGKDTLISYEGCGCAGGQVTTVQGPVTTAVDVSGTTQITKRRTRKSYEDILGRIYKSEVWDLDGAGSAPYSTVETTFDGRDQSTLIRQFAGSDSSSSYQDTTATYDGFGRLATSHRPEQRDMSDNPKHTTYAYNPDGSFSSVTDGNGVTTNYSYTSLGQISTMSWNVGSTGYTTPSNVTFSYDNLGNRTGMTDDLGSMSYVYDSLSQMTSETRDFSDSLPDSPISGGQYQLQYSYQLGGQLKSYTDPWDKEIDYSVDKTGRLSSITGTTVGGISSYMSSIGYRAWGAVKQASYGDGSQGTASFNNALMPSDFQVTNGTTNIISKSYQYYNDGSLKFVGDGVDNRFDRSVTYDFTARLADGKSSTEASGTTVTSNLDTQLPYRQSYQFDAFDHLTQRNNLHWGVDTWQGISNNVNYTWTNNRVVHYLNSYDNDGRPTFLFGEGNFSYNARGQLATMYTDPQTRLTYDGNGKEGKQTPETWVEDTPPNGHYEAGNPTYHIRSTVLGGQIVSEVGPTGRKSRTFVLLGDSKIATQSEWVYGGTTYQSVSFDHIDPSGVTQRSTFSNGNVIDQGGWNYDGAPAEMDPMGGNIGTETPYIQDVPDAPPPSDEWPDLTIQGTDETYLQTGQSPTYTLDGIRLLDVVADALVHSSTVAHCPDNDCGPRVTAAGHITGPWEAHNDGRSGFYVLDKTSVKIEGDDSSTESEYHWRFVEYGSEATDYVSRGQVHTKEQLGDCVRKLFQGYFPDYVVDGRGVSIPNDARFVSGFNSPVAWGARHVNPNAAAVTLGLYEIHYDPEQVNLSSPTWGALGILAEELSHGEQFIKMWQKMPNVPYIVNNPKNPKAPITRTRRPNDGEALIKWEGEYLAASAGAMLNGKDSYWDNYYEIEAQGRRDQIMVDLKNKYSEKFAKGEKICP